MTYEAILWLVCCPGLTLDLPTTADPVSWHSLRCVARDLELWPWSGNWNPDFRSEVTWTRNRWADLCDAPPLTDQHRIPALTLVQCQREFAEQRLAWLQVRRSMVGDCFAVLEAACEDQQWRINVLLCMQCAHESLQQQPPNWIGAKHALRALRDYLGSGTYHLGQWPAHVPHWSFRPIE